jgi:single-strand DNA-binding protein
MNNWNITGNLGKDAEVKSLPSGTTVCEFSVAVKSGYGDKEKTNWANCVIFGKKAEGRLPEFLKKGAQVAISGELELKEWENDKGKGSKLSLVVSELDLIGGVASGAQSSQSQQQPQQYQAPQQAPQMAPQQAPSQLGYYYDNGENMIPEHVALYKSANTQPWAKFTKAPNIN